MHFRHALCLLTVGSTFMIAASRASATPVGVDLEPGTPQYEFNASLGSADPNAITVDANFGAGFLSNGYHPTTSGTQGTVSYTFTSASTLSTLHLVYDVGFFNQPGDNTIVGTYQIGAGAPVQFLSAASPGGEGILEHQDTTISNIDAQNITITWAMNVNPNYEAPRVVLFPNDALGNFAPAGTASGIFTATATFTPEPGSCMALLAIGGVGMIRRRRVIA